MLPLLLALPAALAATPTPDRPSFSRTGWLVAPGTLELEGGATWADGRTLPAMLKYSAGGVVEPRLVTDLAGFDGGSPRLEAGVKVRLVGRDDLGLALFGASAIPVSADEAWYGQLHGLLSAELQPGFELQVDAGVDLAGGPVRVASIPVAVLLRGRTGRLDVFAEGAAWVADAVRFAVDGGAGLRITEILVIDGAVGWDFAAEAPFAKLGLTANLGRP